MQQSNNPDEVMLKRSISSETIRRRNGLPGKSNIQATCASKHNSIQRPKSPLTRDCIRANGHVATLQRPANREGSNSALPSNVNDGRERPSPETMPQHLSVSEEQVKASTTGQQLPTSCLPQNLLPQGRSLPNEVPTLDSTNKSEHNPLIGFFTARVAESVQNGPNLPLKASAFNPHLESPSIRKTVGVDHTKTKPVGREAVGAPPQPTVHRANFTNPQSDKSRRVGMPMAAASPLQNRGSYKPPQMKRPADNSGPRLALGDVTNLVSDVSGDVKRHKIELEAQGASCNEGPLNS